MCGPEPTPPAQETTKGRAEAYQVDTLAWGRTCAERLRARGADAVRYDLIGGSGE
jgi:hypothetical protein